MPTVSTLRETAYASPRLVAVAAGGAAVAGGLSGLAPGRVLLLLVLLAAAGLFVLRPAAAGVSLLLIPQEINPSSAFGRSVSAELLLGNQVFFFSSLPMIPLLLLAAALLVKLRAGRDSASSHHVPWLLWAVLAVAVAAVLTLGVVAGVVPGELYRRGVAPLALVGAGIAFGLALRGSGRARRDACFSVGLCLGFLAASAVVMLLAGQGATGWGNSYLVFYDAATPAAASAVLIALVTQRDRRQSLARAFVLLSAAIVVLLSFRRNVWLSLLVAVLVVAIASPARGRVARALLSSLAVLSVLALVVPAIYTAVIGTSSSALGTLVGTSAEQSTEDHLSDIEVGLEYAGQRPVSGYGMDVPALPGLVVTEGFLYVHNEYVQNWIKFGVLGLLSSLLLIGGTAIAAVRAFRARPADESETDIVVRSAAAFALLVPVCAFTAAFISTTNRWPALLGLTIGVLSASRLRARSADATGARHDNTDR